MPCMHPYRLASNLLVPCGKCLMCRKRKVSEWSFRLMQEDKVSDHAHFLTLTYDTQHVPITPKGYMTLNKRDVQLFFKRLRKHSAQTLKIKYYVCGEYGGRSCRPHYHVILFNGVLQAVTAAWQLGQIHVGDVSGASVGYVLKYMCKQARIPQHVNDDRIPEWSSVSKGMGIGYVTDAIRDYHCSDLGGKMHLTLQGGRKVSMPRYYKDKIYNDFQRSVAGYLSGLRAAEQAERWYNENTLKYGVIEYERMLREAYYHGFKIMANEEKKRTTI